MALGYLLQIMWYLISIVILEINLDFLTHCSERVIEIMVTADYYLDMRIESALTIEQQVIAMEAQEKAEKEIEQEMKESSGDMPEYGTGSSEGGTEMSGGGDGGNVESLLDPVTSAADTNEVNRRISKRWILTGPTDTTNDTAFYDADASELDYAPTDSSENASSSAYSDLYEDYDNRTSETSGEGEIEISGDGTAAENNLELSVSDNVEQYIDPQEDTFNVESSEALDPVGEMNTDPNPSTANTLEPFGLVDPTEEGDAQSLEATDNYDPSMGVPDPQVNYPSLQPNYPSYEPIPEENLNAPLAPGNLLDPANNQTFETFDGDYFDLSENTTDSQFENQQLSTDTNGGGESFDQNRYSMQSTPAGQLDDDTYPSYGFTDPMAAGMPSDESENVYGRQDSTGYPETTENYGEYRSNKYNPSTTLEDLDVEDEPTASEGYFDRGSPVNEFEAENIETADPDAFGSTNITTDLDNSDDSFNASSNDMDSIPTGSRFGLVDGNPSIDPQLDDSYIDPQVDNPSVNPLTEDAGVDSFTGYPGDFQTKNPGMDPAISQVGFGTQAEGLDVDPQVDDAAIDPQVLGAWSQAEYPSSDPQIDDPTSQSIDPIYDPFAVGYPNLPPLPENFTNAEAQVNDGGMLQSRGKDQTSAFNEFPDIQDNFDYPTDNFMSQPGPMPGLIQANSMTYNFGEKDGDFFPSYDTAYPKALYGNNYDLPNYVPDPQLIPGQEIDSNNANVNPDEQYNIPDATGTPQYDYDTSPTEALENTDGYVDQEYPFNQNDGAPTQGEVEVDAETEEMGIAALEPTNSIPDSNSNVAPNETATSDNVMDNMNIYAGEDELLASGIPAFGTPESQLGNEGEISNVYDQYIDPVQAKAAPQVLESYTISIVVPCVIVFFVLIAGLSTIAFRRRLHKSHSLAKAASVPTPAPFAACKNDVEAQPTAPSEKSSVYVITA